MIRTHSRHRRKSPSLCVVLLRAIQICVVVRVYVYFSLKCFDIFLNRTNDSTPKLNSVIPSRYYVHICVCTYGWYSLLLLCMHCNSQCLSKRKWGKHTNRYRYMWLDCRKHCLVRTERVLYKLDIWFWRGFIVR